MTYTNNLGMGATQRDVDKYWGEDEPQDTFIDDEPEEEEDENIN